MRLGLQFTLQTTYMVFRSGTQDAAESRECQN